MQQFDELMFFAQVKARPGMFLGRKSLLSLRDQLFGMAYAFDVCGQHDALRYFHGYTQWYLDAKLDAQDGYACWWNHLLYLSGNDDALAFDAFFHSFEEYLLAAHDTSLQ